MQTYPRLPGHIAVPGSAREDAFGPTNSRSSPRYEDYTQSKREFWADPTRSALWPAAGKLVAFLSQIAPIVPVLPTQPARKCCAVYNLHMTWKRSSVRSRSGPPINPSLTQTCRHCDFPPAPAGVRKGAEVFALPAAASIQRLSGSLRAFCWSTARVVNVKRRATTRMPHQLLCDLDFHAERSQVGREGVTKTVPADMFSDNSGPRQCGTNALLQDAVRTEGRVPFESN